MAMLTNSDPLIAALYAVDGKAEIVGGEIVKMSPTGRQPTKASFAIAMSLHAYAKSHGGEAYPDNIGYLVDLPNRKSFSPDASYYTGPLSKMEFLPQAPDFAVEVRSENDYGKAAEAAMTAKRADYFAAGTKVVWDVDLLNKAAVVRVYRMGDTEPSATYERGETAEAEPAVPNWTMAVDQLFE